MMKTAPIILFGILATSWLFARTETLSPAAQGLVDTERAFALLAKETNTRAAFLAFFNDESITFGQGLHKGKARELASPVDDSLLEWAPAFVDVAVSGDFGYDLGPWQYRAHRADPGPIAWGTFVTIWKKQPDGSWRVALDLGTSHRPSADAVAEVVPATSAFKLAKIDAARAANSLADLLDAERALISRYSQSGADAFLATLSTEARLYRSGMSPALSPGAIRSYFEIQRDVVRPIYELIDGETASSGDLGYVYGWVTITTSAAEKTETKRTNYLRIWKREDGRSWKVVVDVVNGN
jgi:ketosteroid isomerase-like protein